MPKEMIGTQLWLLDVLLGAFYLIAGTTKRSPASRHFHTAQECP